MPGSTCTDHKCRETFIERIDSVAKCAEKKVERKEFWANIGKIAGASLVALGIAVTLFFTSVSSTHSELRTKIDKATEIKEEIVIRQTVMEQEMKYYNEKLDVILEVIKELRKFQESIPHGKIVIEGSDDTN